MTLKLLGKIAWAVFLTVALAVELGPERLATNLAVFGHITWLIVLQNMLVIAAVLSAWAALHHGPLKFSWLNLWGSEGTNINMVPAGIPWLGIAFLVLLAVSLPSLALAEERMFRLGVVTWPDAFKWSLIFGLSHCIVGVPLSVGLALSIGGLWFHYQAFEGGISQSTIHHTAYNLILVTLLFVAAVASLFAPKDEAEPVSVQ